MDPAGTEGDRPRGDHETSRPDRDEQEGDTPVGEDGEERNFPHNAEKPSPTEHERKKNEEDKTIKNVTKKDIEEVWLAAHATVYPELPITRLSGIDWKNARTLVEKFGDEAPAIVDAAVANWDSLIWKIESAKGLFDQGYTPCLHKLAIHADVVLRWWREEVRMSSTEKSTWCEDDLDDEWPIWKPRAQTDSDGQGKKSGA